MCVRFFFTFLFSFISFTISAEAKDNRLTLSGSSTVAPLALEIAKRYELNHPGVRINVQTGGSSRGISDTRRRLSDIGMVSRKLKSDEQDLTAFLIALDGIGVITHKSNQVPEVSDEEIIDIYQGNVHKWDVLGGADLPITVVNKAEGRSTLELFLRYFSLKNSQIKAHVVIGDNQQGIKTVSGIPGAIGYVSIGAAEFEVARGTKIRLLPMAGQPASVLAVAQGVYPLSRELNFVIKDKPVGLIKDFLNFAQSDVVRDLVEAQFFVKP